MKKILLVDINSLFHRAYYATNRAYPNLVDSSKNPIAGTYGFFTTLFKAIKEYGPFDYYTFAYDSKQANTNRKSIDERYKKNRKKMPQEFYNDLEVLLKKYLPKLKIIPLAKRGYEAEDILASCARYLPTIINDKIAMYFLSGDGDLDQCVKYNLDGEVYFIKIQPKWGLFTREDILKKWNVDNPELVVLAKAIAGDSSDNIVGGELLNNVKLILFRDDLDANCYSIDLSKENINYLFKDVTDERIKRLPFKRVSHRLC
jgi:5'-3' exonuclease